MNKFRSSLMAVSVVLLVGSTSSAFASSSACDAVAGNLIVNCGFETGDFSGWTKVDTTNYTGVGTYDVNSGNYAADLGATGPAGTLSQTVTDTAGAYYALSYSLENEIADQANGTPYPGTNTFIVSYTNDIGIKTILSYAGNIAESANYSTYEVLFFGSGSDTITFTDTNGPSYFDLDDVELVDPAAPGLDPAFVSTATPEPSSLVLMGTGVLALAGAVRRKTMSSPESAA